MSWLRSALSKAADKAAEVGSKNNLSRTVKSYAGAVYHQAAGSAKIVQDKLSVRNLNSFKDAVKRLNEVSLHARGAERLQALGRWLAALKEIDRETKRTGNSNPASPRNSESEEMATSPRRPYMALFYDMESGGEPMNFREVFLQSRALEHIITSLILEAPQDEEIGVLVEIFGLCLAGGQELHNAFISSIQDLAKAFSTLSEEVEIRRSDLLELAQTAVTGLKLSTEAEKLDVEMFFLEQKMSDKQGVPLSKDSNEDANITAEVLEYGARVRHYLRRKEELLRAGDTAKSRTEKVQKLKEVTEGLTSSISGIEQKISENRQQKEKAIKYRDSKASEVVETEKALSSEIQALHKRKEQLEAELKEVNSALSSATARHINTQEEKAQFDEASSNIVAHLSIQEEELTKSIAARRAEAGVASTWLGFLEDTWLLQSACLEEKTKAIQHDSQEAKLQFLSIASMNLSYHQEEIKLLLKRLKLISSEDNETDSTIRQSFLETENQVIRVLKLMESLSDDVKTFEIKEDGDEVEKKLLKCIGAIDSFKTELRGLKRPELETGKVKSPVSTSPEVRDEESKAEPDGQEAEATDGWELDTLEEAST
ncbi:golgin subfamily A member 3 [Selaginella moellendorffii]|uniref:golgin subfamily A member 3 n=1 Tax=Selaginella moellendorffii TaxID=88036 RepID=UPI000D1C6721|nr:golgin subfamily A member 3 [Selaginella moellendorffii]|eukprot:XP_024535865.1 golgin subfamily A member 3 [Selaginella moellendorffii]